MDGVEGEGQLGRLRSLDVVARAHSFVGWRWLWGVRVGWMGKCKQRGGSLHDGECCREELERGCDGALSVQVGWVR